jgi:uncharacterized iron-regulated membrane protein
LLNSNSPTTQTALYRAVWRWHFIAGLLSLPFLLNLAMTGALYLFTPEINHILYRSLEDVPPRSDAPLATSVLVQRTADQTQGQILRMTVPSGADKSVQMLIRMPSEESRTAFVDPYDGRLLGSIPEGGVMQIVRKIHSLQYFGFWVSCLVEIAAGWAIVLALSGIFLWWPRGRSGGVLTVRGTPKIRMFWRDLHAVTGLFASAVIVFLSVTGMPWSLVWGKYVQRWTNDAPLPKPPPGVVPDWRLGQQKGGGHVHGGENRANLPWALEETVPPASAPAGPAQAAIDADQTLAILAALGVEKPFDLTFPSEPNGTYSASSRPDRVEDTRVVYVDQYSGKVLADVGFSQYGPGAKAIEWGISVHEGREYGSINRYVMLVGCIGIVVLAISAPVMWWKRRPKGSFGLPPAAASRRAALTVMAVIAIAGMIYPLVGLSMLAALVVERLYELARRRAAWHARITQ